MMTLILTEMAQYICAAQRLASSTQEVTIIVGP